MASIIVFSKDRPLQLHAYLESLLMFSDVTEDRVSVLWRETAETDYSNVIKRFQNVRWLKETSFVQDLLELLDKADDFILFGCDDVVFKGRFSLEDCSSFLEKHNDVFGFSLRLGKNIRPKPDKLFCSQNVWKWNWRHTRAGHYNYPWELDCTLYRKDDVLRLVSGVDAEKLKNPNYLESEIAGRVETLVGRPNLACCSGVSKAMVITVNRVQETHPNPVDDQLSTDTCSLDRIYNYQGKTLDITRISEMKNKIIHVGARYFVLRGDVNPEKNIFGRWLEKCKLCFSG